INYVTVNLGSETLKTVCGAPNVMVGMKSAFAVPGTVIAEGVTVKEQKVYDRISYGILCSPRELGWGDFHIGILSFSDTLSAGTKIANIVPETDYVIEIDNKSITHRPDLWGHYGFARELAAIFGCALKPLETADSSEWKKLDVFPLRIENLEDCPGYACLDIDGLAPAFSPISIQYRLLATGLRPINLLVDLTNYIMCELGQPMHAFDGEKVKDIIVAPFGSKGKFTTLDSADRSMIPEDLMIKDHTGQIAIAGIMGGEETEIKEDTSRILLESANFNPARIRKTSARIGLRTDASLRFEKGQPPYNMILSIKRFVKLLRDAGQKLRIRSQLTCGGNTGEEQRNLSMKKSYINNTIGMDIPQESIVSILESLGFGASLENDDLRLTIPRHRSVRDISIPNDIVEEVARIYGYGNITPSMPDVELRRYDFNTELQKHHKIRRYLSLAKGFNEVHTYSWYDDNWLKRIGYEPGETLKLKNPASENNTRMRLEIMPNLLALIEANSTHRDRFFLYEIGNVFLNEENGCKQIVNLAGIGYQSEKLGSLQDIFLSIKGTIEELFAVTGAGNCTFAVSKNTSRPWYAAGSSMDIMLNGKSIGFLGCLTGKICDVYEKGTQVVWFEFNIDELKGHTFPQAKYDAIPVFPGSWMDFSILADLASSYTGLAEILEQYSHPILRRMKFQYCFKGKGLPENKASYTFRFWLGLRERTLTGDDLTDFRSVFLSYLNKHGLELR
ncbi:MAG: phenylalanine--tRNA ligase subunit beta, partial [Candidatus Latescibacteria bacterium]|nr:phenylalanine--tRNA ligase subunit beta [Candidatus Latescibacterota bacterium]